MQHLYRRYSLLLLCGFLYYNASAQSYETASADSLNPGFYVQAGAFFPVMNTSMRIDTERGLGTDISLENDLKFKTEISAFRLSAMYRLKQKSQFLFSFTDMNRSKTKTIDRDITVGDTIFYANANLKIKFDVDYYSLTWRYSFFNKINWNAGLSFGLRVVEFRTGFEAQAPNRQLNYQTDPTFLAPAAVIGIHGSGYLTPRLLGRYSFEYFQVTVTGASLKIIETQASLSYYFTKNFGLGGGYANSNYNITALPLGHDLEGNVDFSFQGFTLFATARF